MMCLLHRIIFVTYKPKYNKLGKMLRSGIIFGHGDSCEDKCHEFDCYYNCQLSKIPIQYESYKCQHDKHVCIYKVKGWCYYDDAPDCIYISRKINNFMTEMPLTYENFYKFHRQCKDEGVCKGRDSLIFFSETCGCKYNNYAKTCYDGSCQDYKNHTEDCNYNKCEECVGEDCNCSYDEHSNSCHGEKCRREDHKDNCEYRHCRACFGSDSDSDSY